MKRMNICRAVLAVLACNAALISAVPITFVSPNIIQAGGFTISAPGLYVLTDDVSFSPDQALGVLAYVVRTQDTALYDRWLDWIATQTVQPRR